MTGREVRPHAGPGALLSRPSSSPAAAATAAATTIGKGGLVIDSIRVNASGSMVAATARRSSSGERDSRVFLYCAETNAAAAYDFGSDGRVPLRLAWDTAEPRLVAVQVQRQRPSRSATGSIDARPPATAATGMAASRPTTATNQQSGRLTTAQSAGAGTSGSGGSGGSGGVEVALLFAYASNGLMLQEYQEVDACTANGSSSGRVCGLLGLSVPHLLLFRRGSGDVLRQQGHPSCIERMPIQGFTGVQVRLWFGGNKASSPAHRLGFGRQHQLPRSIAHN